VTCVSVRPTRVERESVNTVALCDNLASGECASSRMMVASAVYLNSSETLYSARDTTIMPNIPALLSIVAITFAPNVELRYSAARYSTMNPSLCLSKLDNCRKFGFRLIYWAHSMGP